MISLTGGFNQQFVAGAPKVHKLKYATDSMSPSDAAVAAVAYVANILHTYSDVMSFSESLALRNICLIAKTDTLEIADAIVVTMLP